MKVLITGATGGLGAAVVAHFQNLGAEVVQVARSGDAVIHADLTQLSEAERVVAASAGVDTVVHLLGAFATGGDADAWTKMLTLNLESAVHVFNAAIPVLKQRGGGSLIAVGSRVASEPAAGLAAYGASKAALVHYIRTLALELKDSGIRANIVLPSTIDTAANRQAVPDADFTRWVQPASIAKVIAWLASPDARDVSGAAVPVYGRS